MSFTLINPTLKSQAPLPSQVCHVILDRYQVVNHVIENFPTRDRKGYQSTRALAWDVKSQCYLHIKSITGIRANLDQSTIEEHLRTLSTLKHDCLERVHRLFIDHFNLYICTEALPKGSIPLVEVIHQPSKLLGLSSIMHIAWCTASALAAAEKAGYIHYELSPSCIWLPTCHRAEEDTVILSDLDTYYVYKHFVDDAQLNYSSDPIQYLYRAPEEITTTEITQASVVYSWGQVIAECLMGQKIIEVEGLYEYLKMKLDDPQIFILPLFSKRYPKAPEHIRDGLSQLIERATAPDPSDRFSSWTEIVSILDHLLITL